MRQSLSLYLFVNSRTYGILLSVGMKPFALQGKVKALQERGIRNLWAVVGSRRVLVEHVDAMSYAIVGKEATMFQS